MNKSEPLVQDKRKTMRKLNLYGRKEEEEKGTKHFLASVYVDENKKVIVEAEDSKIKEDLLAAIYDEGNVDKDGKPVFIIRGGAPTEELKKIEEEERKKKIFRTWISHQRPGDPKFLEGLKDSILGKKYGSYYIFSHEIVEK